jgi:parallel beta-helix repeat protein
MRLLSRWAAVLRAGLPVGALAAWLVVVQAARGAEYYVAATGGNNAGPGTDTAPWATLQYAANRVNPGDRIVAMPGNHVGFDLQRSGAAGNPIQFIAQPGARITQRNSRTPDGINLELASHIVIDGFEVFGMPRAGVRSVGLDDDMAEFVTVRNVFAHDNGVWGIFTGHVNDLVIENNRTTGSIDEHGIYVSNSGDRPVLRGNISWGNHGSGIHMNGDESQGGDGIISGALVSGNIIYDNAKPINGNTMVGGSGINMDGVQNSRIENNLVYANRASGISLYRIDGAEGSSGNLVINNSVHQPANGRWALNISDGSTGNTVLNNILMSDHTYRGSIAATEDSLPGMVSNYNALAPRFTTDTGDSTFGFAAWQDLLDDDAQSFSATAAALFVNPAGGDYRLKPGVAAIDVGSNLLAPSVDLVGKSRPQGLGIDLGAIEFATTAAADFNSSGAVDAADLEAWRTGFGTATAATKMQGNADSDADVDASDFVLWQRQLTSAVTAVPEPVGGVWVAAGLCGLSRRVRKPRRRTPQRWHFPQFLLS